MGLILVIILVLLLLGALPHWGYSRSWGYFPSGGLGLILVIIVVLLLLGRRLHLLLLLLGEGTRRRRGIWPGRRATGVPRAGW